MLSRMPHASSPGTWIAPAPRLLWPCCLFLLVLDELCHDKRSKGCVAENRRDLSPLLFSRNSIPVFPERTCCNFAIPFGTDHLSDTLLFSLVEYACG
jgi:hypothetical protein